MNQNGKNCSEKKLKSSLPLEVKVLIKTILERERIHHGKVGGSLKRLNSLARKKKKLVYSNEQKKAALYDKKAEGRRGLFTLISASKPCHKNIHYCVLGDR